jgi:hypothetical protein
MILVTLGGMAEARHERQITPEACKEYLLKDGEIHARMSNYPNILPHKVAHIMKKYIPTLSLPLVPIHDPEWKPPA